MDSKRIIDISSQDARIKDSGCHEPRVDPALIAQALGAEETGVSIGSNGGSPVSLFLLRAELAERLASRGGRPSLEGADMRPKIPMTEAQWRDLEELAASFSDLGFIPSAGQVASALVSISLPLVKQQSQLFKKTLASMGPSLP